MFVAQRRGMSDAGARASDRLAAMHARARRRSGARAAGGRARSCTQRGSPPGSAVAARRQVAPLHALAGGRRAAPAARRSRRPGETSTRTAATRRACARSSSAACGSRTGSPARRPARAGWRRRRRRRARRRRAAAALSPCARASRAAPRSASSSARPWRDHEHARRARELQAEREHLAGASPTSPGGMRRTQRGSPGSRPRPGEARDQLEVDEALAAQALGERASAAPGSTSSSTTTDSPGQSRGLIARRRTAPDGARGRRSLKHVLRVLDGVRAREAVLAVQQRLAVGRLAAHAARRELQHEVPVLVAELDVLGEADRRRRRPRGRTASRCRRSCRAAARGGCSPAPRSSRCGCRSTAGWDR